MSKQNLTLFQSAVALRNGFNSLDLQFKQGPHYVQVVADELQHLTITILPPDQLHRARACKAPADGAKRWLVQWWIDEAMRQELRLLIFSHVHELHEPQTLTVGKDNALIRIMGR